MMTFEEWWNREEAGQSDSVESDLARVFAHAGWRAGQAAARQWRPIADAPHGRPVLVHYRNSAGKSRRVIAEYFERFKVEADPDEDGEYNEADDTYYCPPGWYERIDNCDEFSSIMISEGEPDGWQELPPTEGAEG